MTTADKLTYIKSHHATTLSCDACKLTLGLTCPIKLWSKWTEKEINLAYDILTNKPEFTKVTHEEAEAEMRIKDSGTRRQFDTGAVRDMAEGKGRCDLLPASAVLRLARHFENGCNKYGDRNWEKGIPVHSFIDSAIRHLMKYLDGWTDEDHLCAAAWNCMCAMWTEEHKPDLVDIPTRPEYRRRNKDDEV